jgi:predicted RNA-binding protein with PUA-like domain
MSYWLMKSEPSCFSIDDLAKSSKKTSMWDGVRNYQARNFMRDTMKLGDKVFFYHSNTKPAGIVGICEIASKPYPDPTQFDPQSEYFDPKSTEEYPIWFLVDVKLLEKFPRIISLEQLKSNPRLTSMRVVQKGNRLSICPVGEKEWNEVLQMIDRFRGLL